MKILKTNENYEAVIDTDESSNNFKIDDENQAFIIEALSKNIYQDPIGTIIREYVSNAHDANVESKTNNPIIVKICQDATGKYFSVTDFGVGLSPERVANVFTKYGKSTKNSSNNEIGGFGIGAKSAFSYTDTFFINTVFDGTMYEYILTKTNDFPKMMLMKKCKVDVQNGTEVRIPIKSNYYDCDDFIKKVKRQLCYFENIEFYIYDEKQKYFTDRKMFKNDSFVFSTDSKIYFDKFHAVIGDIAYPIKESLIPNIGKWGVVVGVKFDIGEIDVTLSREEIRYTDETVKKITDKINLVTEKLREMYFNKKRFVRTPFQYLESLRDSQCVVFENGLRLNIERLLKPNELFKFKIIGIPTDIDLPKSTVLDFLIKDGFYSSSKLKRPATPAKFEDLKLDNVAIYLNDTKVLSNSKIKYLHETLKKDILVLKRKPLDYTYYKHNLKQHRRQQFEKGNFTKRIMLYRQLFENKIIESIAPLSEVVIPKSYIDANRPSKQERKILKGSVSLYDATKPFGKSYRKVKIHDGFVYISDYDKIELNRTFIVLVNNAEQVGELVSLSKTSFVLDKFSRIPNNKIIKFLYLYTPEEKVFSELKGVSNIITLDDFNKRIKPSKMMKIKMSSELMYECIFRNDFVYFLNHFGLVDIKEFMVIIDSYKNLTYSQKNDLSKMIEYFNKYIYEITGDDFVPEDFTYLCNKVDRLRRAVEDIFKMIIHFKNLNVNQQLLVKKLLREKTFNNLI